MFRRVLRVVVPLFVLVGLGLAGWLAVAPPDLLRVGTAYSAKIVCSNTFLAGRDARDVLADDVQAPGNPLLRFISVVVDKEGKSVSSHIFGFFAGSTSVYRDGLGCTNLPAGYDRSALAGLPSGAAPLPKLGAEPWPAGDGALDPGSTPPKLAAVLGDAGLTGPGMRAVLVVQDGKLIGEAYGAGFSTATPLLGWSMTKTVNAAIAARLMAEGRLAMDERNLLPEWSGDSRKDIRLSDLMGMESGLRFNEDYGDVSDVTRMLFLVPDMAGFVGGQPAETAPATTFRYSTGTSVLISRIWMNRIGDPAEAIAYPQKALFRPLGMASAVLETDATGTLVGGSYLYATARDWARFGQLLVQDGMWNGERLLPDSFIRALHTATTSSHGAYSHAQSWLVGPRDKANADYALPEDTIWMQGHDGQTITIIPSRKLVVLRMGLTPRRLNYLPQPLVKAVAEALAP